MKSFRHKVITFLTILNLIGCFSSLQAIWIAPSADFDYDIGSTYMSLESDANGHGIVLMPSTFFAQVSYFSNGVWSPPQTLGRTYSLRASALAMEDSGTALAMWSDTNLWFNASAYFDGTNWLTPNLNPLQSSTAATAMAIAMNGPGHGIAIWINYGDNDLLYSIFSAGNWSTPVPVASGMDVGGGPIPVAYSANGTAITGWRTTNYVVTVSIFDGSSWQTPVILDPNGFLYDMGIDLNGNAIVLSSNESNDVIVHNYKGGIWEKTILANGNNVQQEMAFAMSKNGTAIVVWQDLSTNGFSRFYNGTAWEDTLQFSSDLGPIPLNGSNLSVSINNSGEGLVVWPAVTAQIKSSRLPPGGVWMPEEIVKADAPAGIVFVNSSLSANGEGFAGWMTQPNYFDFFVDATKAPLPPVSIKGRVCKDKFAMQTDYIHVISWSPSQDPSVVFYYLKRNGDLLAIIPAQDPLIYYDHNRYKKFDVYSLTAVDDDSVESTPVTIILQ